MSFSLYTSIFFFVNKAFLCSVVNYCFLNGTAFYTAQKCGHAVMAFKTDVLKWQNYVHYSESMAPTIPVSMGIL